MRGGRRTPYSYLWIPAPVQPTSYSHVVPRPIPTRPSRSVRRSAGSGRSPLTRADGGTCPRSTGEAYLDVNDVRARILTTGGLFYRGEPHVYEVGGANALFAANIWIAGLIQGKLHAAATRYGEWEFWAGPLDEAGNPPVDCAPYDRIWEITRAEIEAYNTTGIASENLTAWP